MGTSFGNVMNIKATQICYISKYISYCSYLTRDVVFMLKSFVIHVSFKVMTCVNIVIYDLCNDFEK